MLRAKGLMLIGVATAVFGIGARAEACGGVSCVRATEVLPADGSANVPLNTQIRVRSHYCDGTLDVARLLPATGPAIALNGDAFTRPNDDSAWFIATPNAPLQPETRYEVQRRYDTSVDQFDDEREWITVASFETGAELDHEPPSFDGITAFDYGETVESWRAICSSRPVVDVDPSFEPATDDRLVTAGVDRDGREAPALRYNVYVDGELAVPYYMDLLHDRWGEIAVACAERELEVGGVVTRGANIEVRAVDLAGNESPPNPALAIDIDCTFADTAAPATDDGDVVPTVLDEDEPMPTLSSDEPSRSISHGPGCALPVRAPSAPSPALWPLLALLLPALRRLRAGTDSRPPRRT